MTIYSPHFLQYNSREQEKKSKKQNSLSRRKKSLSSRTREVWIENTWRKEFRTAGNFFNSIKGHKHKLFQAA